MKKEEEHKMKNGNFLDACQNALDGIIYAITTQSNIKKQLLIAVAVMLISLFFDLSRAEFLCLMFTVVLIIVAEMFNTAVETVVDLYTDLYHPKAKIAKDVGAGAVVIAAINAIIVAYFLFFQKISTIGLRMVDEVVNSPIHLAFVAVLLTVIVIVTLKAAATKKHKFVKENFMPSGQTAVAFAALTIVWLTTRNVVIFTLALVLALLVAINRYQTNKRTKAEIIIGACVGVLVVILLYGLAILYLHINSLASISEIFQNFQIRQ